MAVLPAAETLIAGCWLAGIARWRCSLFAVGVVVVASAGLFGLLFFAGQPQACGCLGRLGEWLRASDSARIALIRNGLIVLFIVVGMMTRTRLASQKSSADRERTPCVSRGAFTLLETLLTLAAIGLLVALLVPKLASVKRAGMDSISASNLRSHAQVFSLYAAESKGCLPYFTDPDADVSVVRCQSRAIALPARYYDAHMLWGVALADGWYEGNPVHPSFYEPGDSQYAGGFLPSYLYGCVFIADPRYWNYETRLLEPAQFRAVRLDEALFTDRKALHVNSDRYHRVLIPQNLDTRVMPIRHRFSMAMRKLFPLSVNAVKSTGAGLGGCGVGTLWRCPRSCIPLTGSAGETWNSPGEGERFA